MLIEAQQRVLTNVDSIGTFLDKFDDRKKDIDNRKKKFFSIADDMNLTVKSDSEKPKNE